MSRFDKMREEKKNHPALYTGIKKKGTPAPRPAGKAPRTLSEGATAALAQAIRVLLKDDPKKDG